MSNMHKLHQAYLRAFSGPDGERVLDDLKARGFERQTTFAAEPGRAAFNEGRRSLLLHILCMLDGERASARDEPREEERGRAER